MRLQFEEWYGKVRATWNEADAYRQRDFTLDEAKALRDALNEAIEEAENHD